MEESVVFKVKAELDGPNDFYLRDIKITGNQRGIFINYFPVESIWCNGIQLKIKFKKSVKFGDLKCIGFIVFDHSSGVTIKIKEIYQKLEPFWLSGEKLKENSGTTRALPKMNLLDGQQSAFLRSKVVDFAPSWSGNKEGRHLLSIAANREIEQMWQWSLNLKDIMNDKYEQIDLGFFEFDVLKKAMNIHLGESYQEIFGGLYYHFQNILELRCETVIELKDSEEYQKLLPFIKEEGKITLRDIYEFSTENDSHERILTGYSAQAASAIIAAREKVVEMLGDTLKI